MFGLKQDHFVINPKNEFQIFFARQEEFETFFTDLTATMDSGRPPRYVVFGLFGVGKSHFLLHLKYRLSAKADALYIETPSSHRRSSFIDFYRAVISSLGRMTIIQLLEEGMKTPAKRAELGLSEDLAYVIGNAIDKKQRFILWKYLSGEKLKAAEAEGLEAVRPEITVEDAVSLLNALAILHERVNGKPLILLVDEFESTMNISGDARTSFTEAVRSLVDESSKLGIVFALTTRSLAEMPSAIYEEPVRRRIGVTNYIEFREYQEDELEKFMFEVIAYRRDRKFDLKKAISQVQSPETIDEKSYPFTREAIKEIAGSVALLKEQGTIEAKRPKETLDIMDKALRIASTTKKTIIDKGMIDSVRDQVVEALKL